MITKTRFLYHGTTREYHDRQVKDNGRYEHIFGKEIDLDSMPFSPVGYAVQRSRQYSSEPILLIIDATKVDNLRQGPGLACDYLEPGWYETMDIELTEGLLSEGTVSKLRELESRTLLASKNL